MIKKHEFDSWRCSPVTKHLVKMLEENEMSILKAIGDGSFLYKDNALISLARMIGNIETIRGLISLSFEDIGE